MVASVFRAGAMVVASAESSPLAGEYALFAASDLRLHATFIGEVREARYVTTVVEARARLQALGITPDLAELAAAPIREGLLAVYGRGLTARELVDTLPTCELLAGGEYSAKTNQYEGIYLNMPALTADLGVADAAVAMQCLSFAALLSELPGDLELVLDTSQLALSRGAGYRSHQRIRPRSALQLPAALFDLAGKAKPSTQPPREGPSTQVILQRVRALTAESRLSKRHERLAAAELAFTARSRPTQGMLADPELWSLDVALDAGICEGALQKVADVESAHGRSPATRYLRNRISHIMGSKDVVALANRVAEDALTFSSFNELALLAAETLCQTAEWTRALPFVLDVLANPNTTADMRRRATAIKLLCSQGKRSSLRPPSATPQNVSRPAGSDAADPFVPSDAPAGGALTVAMPPMPMARSGSGVPRLTNAWNSGLPMAPAQPHSAPPHDALNLAEMANEHNSNAAAATRVTPNGRRAVRATPLGIMAPTATEIAQGPIASAQYFARASAHAGAPAAQISQMPNVANSDPVRAEPARTGPSAQPAAGGALAIEADVNITPQPIQMQQLEEELGWDMQAPASRPPVSRPPASVPPVSSPPLSVEPPSRRMTPPYLPALEWVAPERAFAPSTLAEADLTISPAFESTSSASAQFAVERAPPAASLANSLPIPASAFAPAVARKAEPASNRTKGELLTELSAPNGEDLQNIDVDAHPHSAAQVRAAFTVLVRELGEQIETHAGTMLRLNLAGLEYLQRELIEVVPEGSLSTQEDARRVRQVGAFLSEFLAREYGATWEHFEDEELGHWSMALGSTISAWPFGRILRFMQMRHRERDLVSYVLELEQRCKEEG